MEVDVLRLAAAAEHRQVQSDRPGDSYSLCGVAGYRHRGGTLRAGFRSQGPFARWSQCSGGEPQLPAQ